MPCPKCGSTDWRLASAVHAEGLTTVATKTGSKKTTGTHQTAASKAAAPPTAFVLTALLTMAFIGCGFWAFIASSGGWGIASALLFLAIPFAFMMEKPGADRVIQEYAQTGVCQRCGTRYVMQGGGWPTLDV